MIKQLHLSPFGFGQEYRQLVKKVLIIFIQLVLNLAEIWVHVQIFTNQLFGLAAALILRQ